MRIHDADRHICHLHTIHVMKLARRSPMRVHEVAGESAVYYPHHVSVYSSSLLSVFMMRNVSFSMCLTICYPHS
jgi:hypothetical protein